MKCADQRISDSLAMYSGTRVRFESRFLAVRRTLSFIVLYTR